MWRRASFGSKRGGRRATISTLSPQIPVPTKATKYALKVGGSDGRDGADGGGVGEEFAAAVSEGREPCVLFHGAGGVLQKLS